MENKELHEKINEGIRKYNSFNGKNLPCTTSTLYKTKFTIDKHNKFLVLSWYRESYCYGTEDGTTNIPFDYFELDIDDAYKTRRKEELEETIEELQEQIKELGSELVSARRELKWM